MNRRERRRHEAAMRSNAAEAKAWAPDAVQRREREAWQAEIPNTHDLLKNFAERYELKLTDLLEHEYLVIRALYSANVLINAGFEKLDEASLSDDTVGILLNMFHRSLELAEAAVVAFVTGCAAAAEVISRAAVESS